MSRVPVLYHRGNNTSYNDKPIKAKFGGICKVCKSYIKAGKHRLLDPHKRVDSLFITKIDLEKFNQLYTYF